MRTQKVEKTACGINVYFTNGMKLFITDTFLSTVSEKGNRFGPSVRTNPTPLKLYDISDYKIRTIIDMVINRLTYEGRGEDRVAYIDKETEDKLVELISKMINIG